MKAEYVLIGGGSALLSIAQHLQDLNKTFYVILHPVHASEIINICSDTPKSLLDQLSTMRIKSHVVDREEEVRNLLEKFTCKYVFGLGPRWIFSSETLASATRWINININKVPEYLGGAHVSWQIMNEDRNVYVTFQEMSMFIDRGPVLEQYKFVYPSKVKKPKDYLEFNAIKAKEAFVDFVDKVLESQEVNVEINWNVSTYWPRLKAETNGWINWNWRGEHIVRFIKAFAQPYAGARTFLSQKVVVIEDAEIAQRVDYHPFAAGLIIRKVESEFYVSTVNAILKVKFSSIENTPNDLRFVGNRLFTPTDVLESGMMTRVSTFDINREHDYNG